MAKVRNWKRDYTKTISLIDVKPSNVDVLFSNGWKSKKGKRIDVGIHKSSWWVVQTPRNLEFFPTKQVAMDFAIRWIKKHPKG